MKVLTRVNRSPDRYILLELIGDTAFDEVSQSIRKGDYFGAATKALSKGEYLAEISEEEKHYVDADLIITEKNAHWCLV
ncbi:MAG: hypothetical protein P9L88_06940 [Candidatus Tantalella remota]|nr:hypothetical protein [Candidatus Tantalella remota]